MLRSFEFSKNELTKKFFPYFFFRINFIYLKNRFLLLYLCNRFQRNLHFNLNEKNAMQPSSNQIFFSLLLMTLF